MRGLVGADTLVRVDEARSSSKLSSCKGGNSETRPWSCCASHRGTSKWCCRPESEARGALGRPPCDVTHLYPPRCIVPDIGGWARRNFGGCKLSTLLLPGRCAAARPASPPPRCECARAMAGKGHWGAALLEKVAPNFVVSPVDSGALLFTTAPLWAPVILLAALSLFAAVPRSLARLLRSSNRPSLLAACLGPWAARRVLRALRVLLGGARGAAAPQQAAAGLRRSLTSSLSLSTATTETGFAGCVSALLRRACAARAHATRAPTRAASVAAPCPCAASTSFAAASPQCQPVCRRPRRAASGSACWRRTPPS